MNKIYKILIVDDEASNILFLKSILEIEGYIVFTANSGMQSLNFIKQNRPDLILIDIMMPTMDGIEVLDKIKSNPETKDIPVIIITASMEDKYKEESIKLGASAFITLPISRQVILEIVGNIFK